MHELAVTKSLIESIKQEIKKHGIKKPKQIVLELGSLTGYMSDSISFYFDNLKHEVPELKDAELKIHNVDAKVECKDCRKEGKVEDCCLIMCPVCDSTNVEVVEGKDFILRKVTGDRVV
jgi:hydrogenase nickel incorporation protein HypA/HybF